MNTNPKCVNAEHVRSNGCCGLLLAGGRGRRLGGIDKGLMTVAGRPLAAWTLAVLAPQVATLQISANRQLAGYARLGYPVQADRRADFAGPLAGIETGLSHSEQALVLSLPCDCPLAPGDLRARLQAALEREQAQVAIAHDGERAHYLHALWRRELLGDLQRYLDDGGRAVRHWLARLRVVEVDFSGSPEAFANVNTVADVAWLESQLAARPAAVGGQTGKPG